VISGPREFWRRSAAGDGAWFIANRHRQRSDRFYSEGAIEARNLLSLLAVPPCGGSILDLGCGPGRMTGGLADKRVEYVGADIVADSLRVAAKQHQGALDVRTPVSFDLLPGDGSLPYPDEHFDVVFSYITLQHIPSREVQLSYILEAVRVLRPGGVAAIQVRSPSTRSRILGYLAHTKHFLVDRKPTWRAAWRGAYLTKGELEMVMLLPNASTTLVQRGILHTWIRLQKSPLRKDSVSTSC
jgi:SAM-dependent methyltransferase